MKFRQLFATAALGVVLAAPTASAQAPYQSDFWFNNEGTSNNSYDYYTGSFDGVTYFQIICVNPNQFVTDPDFFDDAWVTPFDAADGSNAINPNGNVFLGNYFEAAQLGSLMIGNATTNVWTPSEILDLQDAIWYAMGFGNGGAGNYAYWQGVFAGSGIVLNAENWVVVTDNLKAQQEFITFVDTPFEVVPEPATMTLLATGLAGMAAARRRRKS